MKAKVFVTEKEKERIRKVYKQGGVSYTVLAERFGISASQVGRIVRREA